MAESRKNLSWILVLILAAGTTGYSPGKPEVTTRPSEDLSNISPDEVEAAFQEAQQYVKNVTEIESELAKSGGIIPPGSLSAEARHQRFTKAEPQAIRMNSNQRIFEAATKYLAESQKLSPEQVAYGLDEVDLSQSPTAASAVQDCQALFSPADSCDPDYKFRSADGSCNNLQNTNWGRAFSCFQRLQPPDYADSVGSPRVAQSGDPLPNARFISTTVHDDVNVPATAYTLMTMQWGQFMDHDLTLTPMSTTSDGSMIECCNVTSGQPKDPACFEISIPSDDYFYGPLGQTCINFVRSAACNNGCTMGQRQQTDQLTNFIDASNVYGSLANETTVLREFQGGRMLSQSSQLAGELLPPSQNQANDQCSRPAQNEICFQAGDQRVNEQPALTCMHTIWLRQHNAIADYFHTQTHPDDPDESVFQETRRITGAQLQAITYGEFLPVVLGPDLMDYYNLTPLSSGYTNYDPTVNPTTIIEFATAAYRFGHTLLPNNFDEIDGSGDNVGQLPLRDNFFFPFSLFNGSLDLIMRGLSIDPAMMFDRHIVQDVTNHLYKMRGTAFGMDLPALNIQRGRDHGLPGYTSYVKFCNGPTITSFQDLETQGLMSADSRTKLETAYAGLTVDDIDLFSGGVSEYPNPGAVVGPTFGCIIAINFYNIKFGDRFYFEHGGQAGSFLPDQLQEIRNTPLSRVICANSDGIDQIKSEVFSPSSSPVPCDSLHELNLDLW